MRQQEVFNKVGNILTELNEQYDYLKQQPFPLDDLELELFTANANFLTDHLEILRKLNTAQTKEKQAQNTGGIENDDHHFQNPTATSAAMEEPTPVAGNFETEHPQEVEEKKAGFEFDLTTTGNTDQAEELPQDQFLSDDETHAAEPTQNISQPILGETFSEEPDTAKIDLKPDTGHDHFSFIRSTEPEIIRHELELNEADTYSEDEDEDLTGTVAEALAEIENQAENATVPAIENTEAPKDGNQTFTDKPVTLNERIAAQNSQQQPAAAQQPITDLKSAITLNDKMLFVRDLFNGYSLAYSEAIEILNRFNKLEDAERFLSVNYEAKNNWADKPATREKFYDLLKRRFA